MCRVHTVHDVHVKSPRTAAQQHFGTASGIRDRITASYVHALRVEGSKESKMTCYMRAVSLSGPGGCMRP